ncbi:right-handed parallel beta-helix repeat-containing protein [Desulfosediminicola flagellatus]|uniref:right-handed parallel beta-helix repeat-containing protein n=1 Tax=Desulfosediminicola flagellatus TaxID=2569541 RepID=UPI0010ACDA63|nr:right-handed parallel beta-helix repeat-containing protein [Desulfosediminicola flagellatus]
MNIWRGIPITIIIMKFSVFSIACAHANPINMMENRVVSDSTQPIISNPAVIYVNQASKATSPDGSSWDTAYQTLAEALQSNVSGKEEIWVAQGTYYPTEESDRNASFTLQSNIDVYGGFSGHEQFRRQRNWIKNITILSGEIGDTSVMTDNVYHVVVGADDAILDGFVIQDGYAILAEGETDSSGSLVEVPAEAAAMEILRSVTNIRSSSGGGLLNVHAATATKNCIFRNNYASKGGAVYNMVTTSWDPDDIDNTVVENTPTFENCAFDNNHATARGGAVTNDFFTSSTFVNCVFSNNTSKAKGGALYADMGSPVMLMNVLFLKNEAERGGALVADGVSPHRIVYTTFIENRAYDIGAALYQGTYMGEQNDGLPYIGNEVHLYRSVLIGNESESSNTSISNWHDGLALYDDESVIETVDGSLIANAYINPESYVSKTDVGWHPGRRVNIEYWTEFFEQDVNRTYTAFNYDTRSLDGIAEVIYVDHDAAGLADGTSWSNAFTTLNEALNIATSGSEIWVAAGIYTPTRGSDRAATFVMKEGVTILGGFVGLETHIEDRDYDRNPTILSGDIGVHDDNSDNSYHVLFGATGGVLDGFIIQDGNANGDFHHSRGGGLLCYNSASPDIINSTFTTNSAIEGGAIAAYSHSAPTLINCNITENSAEKGGGMLFRTGPDNEEDGVKVLDTNIFDNTATDRGGAMYIDYGAWPGFADCTIVGNTSTGNGGAVYVDNNSSQLSSIEARFTSCALSNNSSNQRGGAFSIYEGNVFLNNSTVTENCAELGGGGIALNYMGRFVNVDDLTTITNNTSTSGATDIDDESIPER